PLVGNGLQRGFQLEAAITTQAEQRIAGQALRMQATQHGPAIGDIAHRQYDMLLAGVLVEKTMHGEHTERRRPLGSGDEHDRHRRNSRSGKADIVTAWTPETGTAACLRSSTRASARPGPRAS